MEPRSWLLAALLCATCLCHLSTAQDLPVTVPAAAPGPQTVAPSVPFIGGGALSLPNVKKLTPGVLTAVQNVSFGSLSYYYFTLPNTSVDITVNLIQGQGDADLYIIEPLNPAPFSSNGFEQAGWQSGTAINETIFISRNDALYNPGNYPIAVQGYGKGVSSYQLIVQFTALPRVLIPAQKAALQTMFNTCCNVTAGTCSPWFDSQGLNSNGAIAIEICEIDGWECTPDGQLAIADFTNTELQCAFPWSVLSALPALQILRLTNNTLSGPVDWPTVAKLPNIQVFDIGYNQFSGSVTCDLATSTSPLMEFHINDNKFNGTLPACYGAMPQLRVLWLNNNGFTGPLPATIPANSELRSFHVANAGANGTIPESLGLPTNLQTIELSQNLLSGTIPAGIVGPRLDALLLNNNLLTGPIPTNLTTSPQMRTLLLNNNQLTGGIADFANAPNLQQVLLDVNNLTGPMPQTWNSPKLVSLDISNNFINGSLPASLLTLPVFFAFAASNNLLSGPLPDLSGKSSILRIFNVTSNQFTGPIPASYGNLPVFDSLSAKGDPITGAVYTQVFDASYNILNGTIPSFFETSRLARWIVVDLAGNELTCAGAGVKVANVPCGVPANVSIGGDAGPFATKGPSSGVPVATPGAASVVATPSPSTITVVATPSPSSAAAAAQTGPTTSTSSTSNSKPVVDNSSGGGLSTGAIVGIVVGIIVGVIVLAALAVFAVVRVTRQQRLSKSAKSFKRFASMDAEPV